ncbi:hypothetical protein J2Y48_004804 [Mycoplana sp. BE70]|nr:hypothetical protein [Mycoplana sp. BE70]
MTINVTDEAAIQVSEQPAMTAPTVEVAAPMSA